MLVTALTAAARSGDAAVIGEACEVLCIWAVLPHPAWERLLARDQKLLLAMLQDACKLLHTPVRSRPFVQEHMTVHAKHGTSAR